MSDNYCDIGREFRGWLLSIDDVAEWLGENEAVIDTLDDDSCWPLIWFSRRSTVNSDLVDGCGGLPEQIVYDIEVIDHERSLADSRRIVECIRQAADSHERPDLFGFPDSELKMQLIEVDEIDDSYQPLAAAYLPDCCFTAARVILHPL